MNLSLHPVFSSSRLISNSISTSITFSDSFVFNAFLTFGTLTSTSSSSMLPMFLPVSIDLYRFSEVCFYELSLLTTDFIAIRSLSVGWTSENVRFGSIFFVKCTSITVSLILSISVSCISLLFWYTKTNDFPSLSYLDTYSNKSRKLFY